MLITGNASDENGNTVEAPNDLQNVHVEFTGKNNKLVIYPNSKIRNTKIIFTANNGICLIQSYCYYKGTLRIGQECLIVLGARVSCTNPCAIYTAEKTYAIIGDDTMIASSVTFRCEDAHAIYDVTSGDRLNMSKNIIIGEHVWVADNANILSNTFIGDGSVIGTKALVKGHHHNNSLIVGIPSKSIKNNIAWERPHVAFLEPYVRYNAKEQNLIKTGQAWNHTDLSREQIVIGEHAQTILNNHMHLLKNFNFEKICTREYAIKHYNVHVTNKARLKKPKKLLTLLMDLFRK